MSLESTHPFYPCNVLLARGSFDEDGAVPHKAAGALVVGREVGNLATDGHYRMELFTDGHSSLPTSRIPPFYRILLLATLLSAEVQAKRTEVLKLSSVNKSRTTSRATSQYSESEDSEGGSGNLGQEGGNQTPMKMISISLGHVKKEIPFLTSDSGTLVLPRN
ncbi:hypothetical protein Tco_0377213 [Tanacetum coccineum]